VVKNQVASASGRFSEDVDLMRGLLKSFGFSMFLLVFLNLPAEDWPRFRGASGTGESSEKKLPLKWDEKSIKWKLDLGAEGQSSPVIIGKKLFLTAASKDGTKRWVFCVDTDSGKVLWKKTVSTKNIEQLHKMNGFASPSCVSNGKFVLAFFGAAGLHCYDMQGKALWSKDLGRFPGVWGTGASPIIVGDTVIQNCDAEGASYIIALNIKTGK
jgi:outer membrane protein assembly factor BamB